MRIVVIGTSGAGKTTLAKTLAARLRVPHIELDALHWEANWTEAAPEIFEARVNAAIAQPAWVLDGNYLPVRDMIWRRADTLIWLDYSFPVVFGRTLARTFKRALFREVLWNGNRESFRLALLSKHSILLWVLQTYWKRRREFPVLLARPEHAHLAVHRVRAQRETDALISGFAR